MGIYGFFEGFWELVFVEEVGVVKMGLGKGEGKGRGSGKGRRGGVGWEGMGSRAGMVI